MNSNIGLWSEFKLFHRQILLNTVLDKLVHWWHWHLLLHKHLLLHHHRIYHLLLLSLILGIFQLRFISTVVATLTILLLLHLEHLLILLHLAHIILRLWATSLELLPNWLYVLLTKYLLLVETRVWIHHVSKLL
jgi:hypothetical protein